MNVELPRPSLPENEQVVYTRVGPDQLSSFIGKPVALVGRVIDHPTGKKVKIDLGKERSVVAENIEYDANDPIPVVEVRGFLNQDGVIHAQSWNPFGDHNFDIEVFNKMLDYYHNPDYASLTQNS